MNGVTFLTNHSYVLLALHRNGHVRQRDVAEMVGITEGAVHRILHELHDAGYINVERIGRRNHYSVNPGALIQDRVASPGTSRSTVGELLDLLSHKDIFRDAHQDTLFETISN